MVSEIQLLANRENGKLGGVKTEAGKLAVKYNAVTHGLLSKAAIVHGEDATLVDQLRENLMVECDPQGELETMLVELIVTGIWQLRRAKILESTEIFLKWTKVNGYYFVQRYSDDTTWDKLNRYETKIERQMYKAIHELERMQRSRRGENVPPPLAIDVDLPQQK